MWPVAPWTGLRCRGCGVVGLSERWSPLPLGRSAPRSLCPPGCRGLLGWARPPGFAPARWSRPAVPACRGAVGPSLLPGLAPLLGSLGDCSPCPWRWSPRSSRGGPACACVPGDGGRAPSPAELCLPACPEAHPVSKLVTKGNGRGPGAILGFHVERRERQEGEDDGRLEDSAGAGGC